MTTSIQTPQGEQVGNPVATPKSFITTWILALLLGVFGVDRFYLGKVGTGILKLISFGGFGIWWLVDLIIVLTGSQRDKQGHALAGYDQHKKIALIITGAIVVLSMISSIINGATSQVGAPSTSKQVTDVASDTPAEEPAEQTVTVQSWADDTFGTFAPVTETGASDNLITLPAGGTAGIVTATHDGTSNFSMSVLDAANASTGELLVNTIGAYSGTTVYGFNAFGEGATLQVTADGNWTITISPISAAPATAASGTGDAVFLYDGPAGKLTAAHNGSRNFVVQEETGEAFSMGLLVNEIGAYTGVVPLSAGPSVITVQADGGWTLVAG